MTELQVEYFAILREQRGLASETVSTEAATAAELYAELKDRHGFTLSPTLVRAALDGVLGDLDRPLEGIRRVLFIPPVAGG